MIKLARPHQERTIEKLKQSLRSGKKRPMIQLPCGAGKTYISACIIEGALKKNNKVLFVVPVLSLIDQTVKAFHDEGISDIGVIQASHPLTDYSKPVQVASIQTLSRRELPEFNLVINDEAHILYGFMRELMQSPEMEKTIFIGLSATPWTRSLGTLYDDLIVGETYQGLIDQKLLTPFRVFAPAHPDLTGVKTLAGDYNESQLSEACDKPKLVAGIVETWLAKGGNLPTFCFCVDLAHAQHVKREFERNGVPSGYIDAYTKLPERQEIKRQFETGEIKIICNVGTMTTGIDYDVRCIIFARPTQSDMLFVQMWGRGMRSAEGKECLTVLDHSDNATRLGFITDIDTKYDHLDDGKGSIANAKKKKKPPLPKECTACTFLKPAGVHKCPSCGFEPERKSSIVEAEGELAELKRGGAAAPWERQGKMEKLTLSPQDWYSGLLYICNERGWKEGKAAHMYREKFGAWPPRHFDETPVYPAMEVSNWVRSRMIAYARSKKKNTGYQSRMAV